MNKHFPKYSKVILIFKFEKITQTGLKWCVGRKLTIFCLYFYYEISYRYKKCVIIILNIIIYVSVTKD